MGNYTEDNPGRANGYYGIGTTYLRKFDQIKLYQDTSQAVQRGQILIGKCWKLDDSSKVVPKVHILAL